MEIRGKVNPNCRNWNIHENPLVGDRKFYGNCVKKPIDNRVRKE